MRRRPPKSTRTVTLFTYTTVFRSRFSGRMEAGPKGLPVAGQRVEKGQILIRIKPVASAIDRSNQEAQLADLRANLILAKQRVERLESLEGSVPQKDIEAARAELSSLKGRERAVSVSEIGRAHV